MANLKSSSSGSLWMRLLRSVATILLAEVLFFPAQAYAPLDIRVALVIGNAGYTGFPLANPGNDAKAMAHSLRGLGFKVIEVHDAALKDMRSSIDAFSKELADKQAVALFYYAGHGLQIDWHNYLVPVNAKLSSAPEVARETLDVGEVLEMLKNAKSRMNIVVLDACRDNPFPAQASGRGLAQMDAPHGTLLAFATAPGNVADDGTSGNGLYTQHLLIELPKAAAKIEDIFKRTRLAVRTASGGRQVPWESTSLEEDFYFQQPSKSELSTEELERQFEVQLVRWTSLQASSHIEDLQKFLADFPSGPFGELAQFRFNRLYRAEVKARAEQVASDAERAQQAAQAYASQLAKSMEENTRVEQASQAARAKIASGLLADARRKSEEARMAAQALALAQPEAARPTGSSAGGATNESKVFNSTIVPMARTFKIGATATYTESTWPDNSIETKRFTVTGRGEDSVQINNGRITWDRMGNVLANRKGSNDGPRQFYPAEFQVGKRWKTRYVRTSESGRSVWELDVKVVGRERINVPAGEFDTFLIKVEGTSIGEHGKTRHEEWKIWVHPSVSFDIATQHSQYQNGKLREMQETKLTSLFEPT